jgi:hypothetical protein
MGSYPVIVPVSWGRLIEVIVPAWVDVLSGRDTIQSFCREFVPEKWLWVDPDVPGARTAPRLAELPSTYLTEVGWAAGAGGLAAGGFPAGGFPADNLRRSAQHAALARVFFTGTANELVCRAISTRASVELSGPDRFNHFYSRLHEPPHCQVAGTKNHYHFLRHLYVRTYDPEQWGYHYVPSADVGAELVALFEALLFAVRSLPGLHVLAERGMWPAGNDKYVQGYLSPGEVRQLVPHLAELEARVREAEARVGEDERDGLLPLFLDRIQRAADQGLGLVALHDVL